MRTVAVLLLPLLFPAFAQAGPNEDLLAAATAEYGGFQSAERALRAGADVNTRDKAGNTPLILATANGANEVASLLIARGANVNAENGQGRDAHKCATDAGNKDAIAALEKEFKKPKVKAARDLQARKKAAARSPDEVLLAAAGKGELAAVKSALEAGANVNAPDARPTNPFVAYTPLLSAVSNDHADVVELLLAKGADVNLKIGFGTSALHRASERGHPEVVRLLLAAKADVDSRDNFGSTALIAATDNGHVPVMQLLLDAKANPRLRNNDHSNALNRAIANGNAAAVALLRAAGVEEVEPRPASSPVSSSAPAASTKKKPEPAVAGPTPRQAEILEEIAKAERQIELISGQLAQLAGAPRVAPTYDRPTITGQSCDRRGNCTNTYQGGTETVGSYYARTGSGRQRSELENQLAQFTARRDFWVEELRKLDR